MDGMLSQDEISALLSGMDLSGDTPADNDADDALPEGEEGVGTLSDVDKDAIGEVANISMGSSATTLYSLVNRKVNITTPVVELAKWDSLLDMYEKPCVFIQIKYTVGLDGTNILVLKEHDVKVITDLMMGGDGTNTSDELGELHLSAISEAMNQMMGSAATSLSTMLNTMIDISPPEASLLDLTKIKSGAEISPFLGGTFVKISFRMQIDTLVDSTIMQLYPIDFAKRVVDTFMGNQMGTPAAEPEPAPQAAPAAQAAPQPMAPAPDMSMGAVPQGGPDMSMQQMPMQGMPMQQMPMQGMPMQQMPMQGMPMQQMPMMQMPMQGMPMMQMPMQSVNVQPAQFQSFSGDGAGFAGQENIGLIRDVPLEVTVELGRTSKSISEILEFSPGTIIELDRIAGEPIDVLVNGKFVAKGEVVVIEESFGIRVTEIIK
ncbi:MAG: flagellar motor switch phosphatase FliY [Clostridium sp.]|nr:flagellar motor switch phosphatase FliY [Bacteroides sp.]MCM1562235.1 flagellar motor switch phosphatase FliY [Clostridium sp.]